MAVVPLGNTCPDRCYLLRAFVCTLSLCVYRADDGDNTFWGAACAEVNDLDEFPETKILRLVLLNLAILKQLEIRHLSL